MHTKSIFKCKKTYFKNGLTVLLNEDNSKPEVLELWL